MSEARIIHICQRCNGEGFGTFYNYIGVLTYENPCSHCGGDGRADSATFIDTSDITDKLDDVLEKVNDVLEAVQELGA